MQVSMPKTFSQHVARREKVAITVSEANKKQKDFDHKCEYCARSFETAKAMKMNRYTRLNHTRRQKKRSKFKTSSALLVTGKIAGSS